MMYSHSRKSGKRPEIRATQMNKVRLVVCCPFVRSTCVCIASKVVAGEALWEENMPQRKNSTVQRVSSPSQPRPRGSYEAVIDLIGDLPQFGYQR